MSPTELSPEGKKKLSLTIKKESAKVAENLKNKNIKLFKYLDIVMLSTAQLNIIINIKKV